MCRPVDTQYCRYRITCLTCHRNTILLPKCGYQSLSQNKLTSYRLCESMLGTHKYLTFKTSLGRKWFSNIHFIHLWTTFLQQINFCQSHLGSNKHEEVDSYILKFLHHFSARLTRRNKIWDTKEDMDFFIHIIKVLQYSTLGSSIGLH